jgi:protocatechuate 4,5-dioxygenase alpha chain
MTKVRDDYLLDLRASREGYPINRLCLSLRYEANRRRFADDEAAYCDSYGLSGEQKRAVMARDWTAMLDLGTSVFYLIKLASLEGKTMQDFGAACTGMSVEDFRTVLRSGGRIYG